MLRRVDPATIEIEVDTIHGPATSPLFGTSLDENTPQTTFEFDLVYAFPSTLVEIRNVGTVADSNVVLDGDIENPIGTTLIQNERGDIRAGADAALELIRTNVLVIDAYSGSIGELSPRRAIAVELVRFRDIANVLHDLSLTAYAAGDLVLDLTANRRSGEPSTDPFTVTIGSLSPAATSTSSSTTAGRATTSTPPRSST